MKKVQSQKSLAFSATLHCLTGCAIGEVLGLVIGTAMGFSNTATIILAIGLAFLFGFGLSTLPLRKFGMSIGTALSLVVTADTLSIAIMEIVDNLVMVVIPGALHAHISDPLFWSSMAIALAAAFVAAYPVNLYLLKHGRGHALYHKYMGHDHEE